MDAVNKVFKSEHYPDWVRGKQVREKVTRKEKEMYCG